MKKKKQKKKKMKMRDNFEILNILQEKKFLKI